jgi:hypothetical protein
MMVAYLVEIRLDLILKTMNRGRGRQIESCDLTSVKMLFLQSWV